MTGETPEVRSDKRKPRENRQNHRYHESLYIANLFISLWKTKLRIMLCPLKHCTGMQKNIWTIMVCCSAVVQYWWARDWKIDCSQPATTLYSTAPDRGGVEECELTERWEGSLLNIVTYLRGETTKKIQFPFQNLPQRWSRWWRWSLPGRQL